MGKATRRKAKRNTRILEKANAGKPSWEIASDHHITTQRVLQIVAAERRRRTREAADTAQPGTAQQ